MNYNFPPGTVFYQPAIYQNGPVQQTIHYPMSSCVGNKKALLIGINYTQSSSPLRGKLYFSSGKGLGCHNDIWNIKQFLVSRYRFMDDPHHIVILMDDPATCPNPLFWPTRVNITNAITWLMTGNQPGDSLFFQFSGHGSQVRDRDGDEADGYDETILPVDYLTAGQITDDELHDRLVRMLSPGVRLTAIFDSCHSGTALDLPYVYDTYGRLVRQTSRKVNSRKIIKAALSGRPLALLSGISQVLGSSLGGLQQGEIERRRATWSDAIMISGCEDSQTSADATIHGVGNTGAMSFSFLTALSQNPNQSYSQLLGSMRAILKGRHFSQVPQLSSGHPMDMNMPFLM